MTAATALARLAQAYRNPDDIVAKALAAGRRPIRTLGVDAPFALLREYGFQPVRLAPHTGPTPLADAIMGGKGLLPRGRGYLEAILASAGSAVPLLITTADVEQTQLFATLRELARLDEVKLPPIFLLDLCHQPRPASRNYSAQRTTDLVAWLQAMDAAPAPRDTSACDAQALIALREQQAPKLSGVEFLHIAGTAAILMPQEHAQLVRDIVDGPGDLPERAGPRVFLAGSLQEDDGFYQAVEALGATIVGEDHAWGQRFLVESDIVPIASELPAAAAARIVAGATAVGATHILHLTIGEDEGPPWQIAPLRPLLGGMRFAAVTATAPDQRFTEAVQAFLTGVPREEPARAPKGATSPPGKPRETRSRKALASVGDFGRYQREWFAGIRKRAARGETFAVVNANAPQEILRALDVPFVVNQWWASIVAAKQQSRRYLGLLRAHDLPARVETYSAQGLAAAFDDDAENAPWGGLPKPTHLHAVRSSDATAGLFEDWAAATDAELYLYERTVDPRWSIDTDWWSTLPDRWDEALEPERLDLLVSELRTVIATLESATGRSFDPARFEEVMHLVNEQEEYYRRTRDLIARTIPAPIGVSDQMPATMVPQWHRGTTWGRDAARAFYDEVAAQAAAGDGAVANERVRLMWVGRGLWSEMSFYQRWEESHGAVFVCSMYLSLAADGYIRNFDRGRDPLRALAARFLTMGDELRMPSWAAPWHVHEAQTHQVDGAVALADADPFVLRALEKAGIPVLDLGIDNFNREGTDEAAIDARVAAFIEGPAGAKAEARRASKA